jgi:hypothetical protein
LRKEKNLETMKK